jgi:hypothetical protein
VVLVVEAVADVRCPLALVLGSPLLASHVLAVGARKSRETFIKIYKINVTRRKAILALTNKPTDYQMHEARTKKQSYQPFNKNCSNTQYTVHVHKLIAH